MPTDLLPDQVGRYLLRIARATIVRSFEHDGPDAATTPEAEELRRWLNQPRATFVTITLLGTPLSTPSATPIGAQQEELHGCVGSLEPRRSLAEDVAHNALAAAFNDPRSSPLERSQIEKIRIEVSVLSPLEAMNVNTEDEALHAMRPHVDGIVFAEERRRSTFLPQVWEKLPEPREFLTYLKLKAGLPANYWSPSVRLYRYTSQKWRE